MKIKTSELTDHDLVWAVALCEGKPVESINWQVAGPIIEREGIRLYKGITGVWWACTTADPHHPYCANTPAMAAMLCYVCSVLGKEVDVPDDPQTRINNDLPTL